MVQNDTKLPVITWIHVLPVITLKMTFVTLPIIRCFLSQQITLLIFKVSLIKLLVYVVQVTLRPSLSVRFSQISLK